VTLRQVVLAAAIVLVVGLAATSVAHAQKAAPACGLRTIPMAVGNYWVYKVAAGTDQVTIKVTEVIPAKEGKATTIKLAETWKNRTITTQVTCTPAGGYIIPPDSFFFAGEPGGGVGVTLTVTAHDAVTILNDEALVPETPWIELLKADAVREPHAGTTVKHEPAKIELERHCLVKNAEEVVGLIGSWNAAKFTFELRGRAFVGAEKVDIPIKRPGAVWYQRGIGVVKLDDAFERTWELVETNFIAQKLPGAQP
jgi:hypothetical protein